jgi:hypothetical protein
MSFCDGLQLEQSEEWHRGDLRSLDCQNLDQAFKILSFLKNIGPFQPWRKERNIRVLGCLIGGMRLEG